MLEGKRLARLLTGSWPFRGRREMASSEKWTASKRRVAGLGASTVLGISISLGATLLLARVYTPETLGGFSVLFAIASLVSVAATLRLEYAFVVTSKRAEVRYLLAASLTLTILVSLTSALIVGVALSVGALSVGMPIGLAASLTGILVFVLAVYSVLTQLNLYRMHFRPIAHRNWLQALCVGILQVSIGLKFPLSVTLLAGEIVGRAIAIAASNLRLLRSSMKRKFRVSPSRTLTVMRTYSQFPSRLLPAALTDAALLAIPVVVGAITYNTGDIGSLSLAIRITAVPGAVIGIAIGQLLTGDRRTGLPQLRARVRRWSIPLTSLGVCVAIVLYSLSPTLVGALFPSNWAETIVLVQGMALFSGVSVSWLAFQQIFRLVGRPTTLLILNSTKAGVFLLAMSLLPFMGLSFATAITISFTLAAVVDLLGIALAYRAVGLQVNYSPSVTSQQDRIG